MSHKKFGPDRFSRFDVYWIQTNRQTDRQTNRQAKFIYRLNTFWVKSDVTSDEGTVVNQALLVLQGGSLEITLTIYLRRKYMDVVNCWWNFRMELKCVKLFGTQILIGKGA